MTSLNGLHQKTSELAGSNGMKYALLADREEIESIVTSHLTILDHT
jgi:hypothetical protein